MTARPGGESDAILGLRPETVYEPRTVAEASEVVGRTAREGKSLSFVGGGTELGLGSRPEKLDAVLRTGGLDRIVEHAPSDQIVIVEAGLTLDSLQKALSAHGQRLALDPPQPDRATLGGLVAANAFGPRRARYGSMRDLIIGVSIIRADGTAARGGGKVVKNVAGFDMPKLMVGSLGTLGLIATATFRVHPLPEEIVTLLVPGRGARDIRSLVARLRGAQLEPAAVVALWRAGGTFDFAVCFEGFARGVAEQRERFAALVSGEGAACDVLDGAAATALWARHDALRAAPAFRAKLAALPTSIEQLASETLPPLLDALENPGWAWYATLGVGFVTGEPRSVEAVASAVASARAHLARSGATLVLQAAPPALRERAPVWGAPPPALDLMRSVKERLDPERRLSPGRFVGGI
jgi:glycolate dehydrogenase FAD-binding subunit